ncbi:Wzy polymerase domain-containing protein [Variovorax sp. ZS18.2.2]|uniref:PglL family O-oligosaccharyltransferase n=1 Tax=Variovorax sp. ZS18.2.2 TaxID=2971255 RepID=UPI002151FC62|nr:Wzy polymerase domain-containing protein [Variovorax sp. ZS18.2.2]MCR6479082.1 Wzy polymerase domain-containing protein [Variovorax sp. ZS18.2.2]
MAFGLLIAGLISAAIGLLQYYDLAELFAPWITEPGIGQAYGSLRQRNQFATLLSMALIAALWLHAGCRGVWRRRLLMGASGLLTVGLAASVSRTGLLQLLLVVGLAAFMAHRERRAARTAGGDSTFRLPSSLALLALIPLYFAASWLLPLLVGGEVQEMFGRLRQGAVAGQGRLDLWSNVLTLIAQRPWLGWGWGELSYAHYSTLYAGPRFPVILDNAHNLPLHLAVELGIPAALLICGGFVWMVIAARPWAERSPTRLMAWGLLGVILLHSLLEYPLWYGPFQLVFGVCLGMLWPQTHGSSNELPQFPVRKRGLAALGGTRKWLTLAAVTLLSCLGYAAWDYTRISQIYLPRSERLSGYQDDTLAKLQGSWLFANQVRFAELTLTDVTPANAERMYEMARSTVHFSPEPRVIIKLIESAQLSGHSREAQAEIERFRVAFPAAYERWLEGSR